MRIWRLDDAHQTLVLGAEADRIASVIHWGAPLPQGEPAATQIAAARRDLTGGMLDAHPDLSLSPAAEDSFPGQPGLVLRLEDGRPILPRFRFCDASEDASGVARSPQTCLTLRYRDPDHGLCLQFQFALDPDTHVMTAQTRLEAETPVRLSWLAAPVMPGPDLSDDLIDVSGRWCGEFQLTRVPWMPGIRLRENRTGRTGHEHFPGLFAPGLGATNCAGEVWAFHYGWSGGHRMIAEELPDGRRQIQWGHAVETERRPARVFETAPLFMVYSDCGLNGCGRAFQRHLRDRVLPRRGRARPRPVHYNCWEAVYFDHDLATLKEIATRAADLGAERFVLDDGWFGLRDHDRQGLGDWWVDPRKYPDGLDPLIAHVSGLGLQFGLWVEPEMISADSALYRAHPDWVLGPSDQIPGRQQYVLDLARADVAEHLFDTLSQLLRSHAIDYLKWDHNRILPQPDTAQTHAIYRLLDRLRETFPELEIESCASGGGRADFGMLSRTERVWLSDSNDALERMRIQHDAALFLPQVVSGSHVGPRRSHTSGRTHDMSLRAWVAAQRHMGFECDPRELDPEEAETLARVTAWWKSHRAWLAEADILRLDSADPAVVAEMQLCRSGARFVLFAGQRASSGQIAPRPLRLTGLARDAMYRLDLVNRADLHHLSRGRPALKDGPIELSGQWLMGHGLHLPWTFPEAIWVVEAVKLGS